MLEDLKKLFIERRLKEEQIYAFVLNEIESGIRRDGLWAKALAESKYLDGEAKALYLKLRVQSIKDELALSQPDKKKVERKVSAPIEKKERKARASSIPAGLPHTSNAYACENCNFNGQLFIQSGGLFKNPTYICPACGNRAAMLG